MIDGYFNWLYNHIVDNCMAVLGNRYDKLLKKLYETEFVAIIDFDGNRVSDGLALRDIYTQETGKAAPKMPCSVLEVLFALSVRCEEQIMKDKAYGDRSGTWFWEMLGNMGLGRMTDDNYDEKYVGDILNRFLSHNYDENGRGCAFRSDIHEDLSKFELWKQMNFHLNDILGG